MTATTVIVIGTATILLIAYDIWVAVYRGTQYTISQVIWNSSKRYPIIPFSLGVLFGHLVWSQC